MALRSSNFTRLCRASRVSSMSSLMKSGSIIDTMRSPEYADPTSSMANLRPHCFTICTACRKVWKSAIAACSVISKTICDLRRAGMDSMSLGSKIELGSMLMNRS